MKRYGAHWSVLPQRTLIFRYKVRCAYLTVRCRTKARARFLAVLLGGTWIKRRKTVVVTDWLYIKFWGRRDDGVDALLCVEWVPSDTVARQLAFKWETKAAGNQTAWVSGQNYDGKLRRPHSATDVPF